MFAFDRSPIPELAISKGFYVQAELVLEIFKFS